MGAQMFDLNSIYGILGHLGALLLLLSALAGGSRSLHALALAASILLVITLGATGATPAALWATALALANAGQLFRLAHRNRRSIMTAEQRELIESVLQVHDPEQKRELLGVITWRDAKLDEVLMWQGQKAPPLIYLVSGQVTIEQDEIELGTCGTGDFIGEMSLISGQRATATVTVVQAARIAVFDREHLLRLTAQIPSMARALDQTFNRGLTEKIQRMNKSRAEV
jgi:CRP-like cAMP-binding protein